MVVACLNQDAEDLFSETDLTGMDLEKAMPVIIQQAVADRPVPDVAAAVVSLVVSVMVRV